MLMEEEEQQGNTSGDDSPNLVSPPMIEMSPTLPRPARLKPERESLWHEAENTAAMFQDPPVNEDTFVDPSPEFYSPSPDVSPPFSGEVPMIPVVVPQILEKNTGRKWSLAEKTVQPMREEIPPPPNGADQKLIQRYLRVKALHDQNPRHFYSANRCLSGAEATLKKEEGVKPYWMEIHQHVKRFETEGHRNTYLENHFNGEADGRYFGQVEGGCGRLARISVEEHSGALSLSVFAGPTSEWKKKTTQELAAKKKTAEAYRVKTEMEAVAICYAGEFLITVIGVSSHGGNLDEITSLASNVAVTLYHGVVRSIQSRSVLSDGSRASFEVATNVKLGSKHRSPSKKKKNEPGTLSKAADAVRKMNIRP